MEYFLAAIVVSFVLFALYRRTKKPSYKYDDQIESDTEEKESLSSYQIGLMYERYIGYFFESNGYDVEYNGAKNKFKDMGRDLIVCKDDEMFIIQTKYWKKFKKISENHIFQLYGSLIHFRRTSENKFPTCKAIFYTTAKYSESVEEVAQVLGIELRTKKFDESYPNIKCHHTKNGYKIFLLPEDKSYDQIKMNIQNGDRYVYKKQEALDFGFRRPKSLEEAA